MKEMLILGLKLFIITAVSALVLAFTNSITAPVIAENERLANEKTRKELLNTAETFEQVDISGENIVEVFKGTTNGQTEGYVIKTSTAGYGGEILVMVGIDKEGSITNVQVVKHEETPGLGANAKNESFSSQYQGKQAGKNIDVVKTAPNGEQIQAITGATITSKAVTKGVNAASKLFHEKLKE